MKLNELAALLGCQAEGDPSLEITGVAPLESARESELSFFSNPKYRKALRSTNAGAVIVGHSFQGVGQNLLRHDNPYLTFAKAIEVFHSKPARVPHIHPTAYVSASAVMGKDVHIAASAFVSERVKVGDGVTVGAGCVLSDDVEVGEGTILNAGCVIGAGVQIGRGCVFDFNCVIGAEGFAYARNADGTWYKMLQVGVVIIEDNVGVGACTCIARATIGETRISRGSKIDALVQVGHGSTVGRDSLLCAQVGLAGSTKVGNNVVLAGQVGVAGHLTIGDGAAVTGQSGVGTSVENGSMVSGSPSFDHHRWLRSSSSFKRLPEVFSSVNSLEKRIRDLENILKA